MLQERQTGTVTIAGGDIYYECVGQGTPLILCHAGFVDSGMWDAQIDVLAQHFQVIRYDMQGYGQSSVATQPISRRHELRDLMQKLNIDKAILMGCSMGGTSIIDFALEYPEKVQALISVSATPGGFDLQGEPPRYLFEMMDALQQGDLDTGAELQTRIWFDGMFREPQQVDADLRQQVKAMSLNALQKLGYALGDSQPLNPLDPPAITRLEQIDVPTLIIAGAVDHPEILRATTLMSDKINGATHHILDNSAHLPNMEQADRFNQLVMDFLRDIQ